MVGNRLKALIIAGRNAPILLGVYCSLRQTDWPFVLRAACLALAAALSAALISWTERWLDPRWRALSFNRKEFAANAGVFFVLGLFLHWYFQHGGYWADLAVGGGLALVLAGSQYLILGEAFFFTKLKALAFYAAGLLLVVPAALIALRYSLALPGAPALIAVLAVSIVSAPVLLYANYMQDG